MLFRHLAYADKLFRTDDPAVYARYDREGAVLLYVGVEPFIHHPCPRIIHAVAQGAEIIVDGGKAYMAAFPVPSKFRRQLLYVAILSAPYHLLQLIVR